MRCSSFELRQTAKPPDWGGYDLGSFHQKAVTDVAKQMAKTATANAAAFVAPGLKLCVWQG